METALYSNWKPRETDTLDFIELYEWARDYHTRGQFPVPAHKRFWIMQYQIPQAIAYRGKEAYNYAEGLAALIVNALIFAAVLKLPIFSHLNHKRITDVRKSTFNAEETLVLVSNCWQMIHYQQAGSIRHRARYKEELLTRDLAKLIENFSSYIPAGYEAQAIHDTTHILTHSFK